MEEEKEQPHLIAEMKNQIQGAFKEHEKIQEGKVAYEAKKPEMFKEIIRCQKTKNVQRNCRKIKRT